MEIIAIARDSLSGLRFDRLMVVDLFVALVFRRSAYRQNPNLPPTAFMAEDRPTPLEPPSIILFFSPPKLVRE